MEGKFSPQFTELSPRLAELCKLFAGRDETVKVGPEGWTFLKAMKKRINEYLNFEFENSDVIVSSFPKSGTTWTQEIVWMMRNNPNLDNPKGKLALNVRTPPLGDESVIEHYHETHPQFVEKFIQSFPDYDQSCGVFVYALKKSFRPRTIKTHLPFCLMPQNLLEKGKVVYIIRDPRDVCISYHHHSRLFFHDHYQGSFDQFIDAFIEDAVLFGPYWAHVRQAWKLREHPNVHVMFYEKGKKNPKEEISKLNDFLETNLTEHQIEKVIQFTSFEEMKKRDDHCVPPGEASDIMDMEFSEKEAGFFRKGEAGGWRKVLTQQQKDKFESWIEKNCPDKEIMENILNP